VVMYVTHEARKKNMLDVGSTYKMRSALGGMAPGNPLCKTPLLVDDLEELVCCRGEFSHFSPYA
jgi:hypothetical protein